MKKSEEKANVDEEIISKTLLENEQNKEEKFVNLIVEIIVLATLKEYYEKSD